MGNPMIEIYLNNTRVQAHEFDKDSLTIGRSRQNDIALDDLAISRVHAKLTKSGDDILLEDQNSENGCFLNGLRIRRAVLQPEDEILIARYRLKLTPVATQVTPIAAAEAPASEIRQEFGTIFVPPQISAPGTNAVLVLRTGHPNGEKIFAWDKPELLIGRGGNCEISIFEAQVARRHARLLREGDRYVIEDIGSANGTRVNGKRITTYGLAPGDTIGVGTHEIVFRFDAALENSSRATQEKATAEPEIAAPESEAEPEIKFAFEMESETKNSPTLAAEPPASAAHVDSSAQLNLAPVDTDACWDKKPETAALDETIFSPSVTRSTSDDDATLSAADAATPQMSPPPLPKRSADSDTAVTETPAAQEDHTERALATPRSVETTIPEDLRVTPIEAILKAAIEPTAPVSSLFDTDVTLTGVDSQGTLKTLAPAQATTLMPPPLPKQRQAAQTATTTGITQPLHPELVETQIKLRPQTAATQEIALEICIDLDAIEPEIRDTLQRLCESGLDLPARLRLRTK